MTSKDKQDVISVCRILADKMSDSGKVAVQQIIGAVEDIVENEPCEDCISRTEALNVIEEQKKGFYGVERYAIDECHSAVMKLPSVTPQPKVGKWIRQTDNYHDYYECEHCGIAVGLDDIRNYCPNCGSYNGGGEE